MEVGPVWAAQGWGGSASIILVVVFLVAFVFCAVFIGHFSLWLQALLSNARVSFFSLVAMRLRRVDPSVIVQARIMSVKAGTPLSVDLLESHSLAGGNVANITKALIVAHKAGVDLSFEKAAALDLAGRDVLGAVQTHINPKVIRCPLPSTGRESVTCAAMDGVELRVRAMVMLRAKLERFAIGPDEEAVITSVEEGIADAVAGMSSCDDVLEDPAGVAERVLAMQLDGRAAWEILSIDILVDRSA